MRVISKSWYNRYEVEDGMLVILDSPKFEKAQFVKTIRYKGTHAPENPEGQRYLTITDEIRLKKRGKTLKILPDRYGEAYLVSTQQKEQLLRYLEAQGYLVLATENLDTYEEC